MNLWASEGRVLPETMLQSTETGAILRAREVPGLRFSLVAPPIAGREDNHDAIMTFVFGALTYVMCAPIFCWFAWSYAQKAEARGGSMAQAAKVVGIISLVWGCLSILFGIVWLLIMGIGMSGGLR